MKGNILSIPISMANAANISFFQNVGLRIPAIRRLHQSNDILLGERQALRAELTARVMDNDVLLGEQKALRTELTARVLADVASRFFHYNTCFDPLAVMRHHAATNLLPRAGFLTNYLGVVIDPKFFPQLLLDRAGEVEAIPIPANWHADIAEWGAVLRAVDLATDRFTMIELGCGWGCWMNNAGVAARRAGLKTHLIGVEGDEGHIGFARESTAANAFLPEQVTLHRGIAAAEAGTALFPRQEQAGIAWGLEPIFGVNDALRDEAVASGKYDALPMVPLADLAAQHERIDLLHIDIQGGEANLIAGCLPTLCNLVAYIVIGTHSREIEGTLFGILLAAGWRLEIERPAILSLDAAPIVVIDGVQGWRNPALLPPR